MLTLPPLPPTVKILTTAESDRLNEQQRPGAVSLDDWCGTCGTGLNGPQVFRWFDDMTKDFSERTIVDYRCNCEDQFKLRRWLGYHGVRDQFARMFWGDAFGVAPAARAFIESYLADAQYHRQQGNGLFLYGANGNGKSLLASLVFRHFLAEGARGYWATWNEVLDLYTSTWRDDEERAWFDKTVRNAPVLVIDDLGKESVGRQTVAMPALDSMFRSRVQGGLITIMTTNEPMEKFQERYSKSIVSLATEACLPFAFLAGDYRPNYAQLKEFERQAKLTRPWTFG
jgi:DNA replication protein DnaC